MDGAVIITPRVVRFLAIALTFVTAACATTTSPAPPGSTAPSAAIGAVSAHDTPAGATAPVDDATWALVDRIAAPTYTADVAAAFETALARAGIAVVPDGSTDPATATPDVPLAAAASPFELLEFQAHALAVGSWAGATWSGAELDSVVALPAGTGAPSLAELLAAYTATAATPAGAFARALLAGQDLTRPASVRFPAVVLVLFASDVATDGGTIAAPSPGPSAAAGLLPLAMAGPGPVGHAIVDVGLICGGPSAWIDAIVDRIEHAISAAVPAGVAGTIIAGALGWLIHIGVSIVKSLINALTAPVLGVIRGIAAIASGMAEQLASLLPYAVQVTVSGGQAQNFFLGSDPFRGSFDVQVSGGDLPAWPPVLATCAQAAGIALPDFTSKDVPLTFGPIVAPGDPLLAPTDAAVTSTTTDASGQAHWPFVTARDPGDGKGQYTEQTDIMPVAVHRKELDDLRRRLTGALLGQVPDLLRPFVGAILEPILDGIQGRLNGVLDARGQGSAHLWFRQPVPPTPSPSISPTPSGDTACGASLAPGTYQGTLATASTTIVPPGQIDLGESGGSNDRGSGPLTVTVAPDGTLSGSFHLTMQMHQVEQGLADASSDMTVEEQGAAVTGTLCSLTLTFASETITACQSTGYAGCGALGTTVSLAGLVPPLPLGAPTSISGTTLTWSVSAETSADAGFGGLSAEVQSTTTVTLTGR